MANVNFFSPDGGTTRYPIEDTEARNRIAGQQSLLKDTVGWTGKNRAYSQTNNAVIAHIESGITYDVSWTGSATVTLKKNSASGATITSGSTSPLSFTADADYDLYFGSSADVTEIMVKDSRITDTIYEPHHESVEEEIEQIYADNGVLGAKNILPNNANSGSNRGVTYTVNSDKSVTANGTATGGNSSCTIYEGTLPAGNYLLSGGVSDDFRLVLRKTSESVWRGTSVGNSVPVTIEENTSYTIFVWVKDTITANNVVYKPMLRLASDPDDTYQPYAMTNRELTEDTLDLMGNVFRNQRLLTTSDDLNNTNLPQGVYLSQGVEVVNKPSDITGWWHLINIKTGGFMQQFIIAGNALYTRYRGGSPIAWSSWRKLTGTVVS